MLEILQYVTSSFWVWVGVFLMLTTICSAVAYALKGFITYNKISTR